MALVELPAARRARRAGLAAGVRLARARTQPGIVNGITEPAEFGVLYGPTLPTALGDATWLVDRGGIYAPVLREASVTSLPTWLPGAKRVKDVQVYRFEYPYPDGRYELSSRTTTVTGWAAPPGWGDRPAR